MDHEKESEEEFDKDTQILEEIAKEAERGRDGHEVTEFDTTGNPHTLEPLKGPHHTPVKE